MPRSALRLRCPPLDLERTVRGGRGQPVDGCKQRVARDKSTVLCTPSAAVSRTYSSPAEDTRTRACRLRRPGCAARSLGQLFLQRRQASGQGSGFHRPVGQHAGDAQGTVMPLIEPRLRPKIEGRHIGREARDRYPRMRFRGGRRRVEPPRPRDTLGVTAGFRKQPVALQARQAASEIWPWSAIPAASETSRLLG